MALNKFEDFENNLKEEDKSKNAADYKAAIKELFGNVKPGEPATVNNTFYVYQIEEEGVDVVIINKGTGSPFVKVKIIGFYE